MSTIRNYDALLRQKAARAMRHLRDAVPDPQEPIATAGPKAVDALRGIGIAVLAELQTREGAGEWWPLLQAMRSDRQAWSRLIGAAYAEPLPDRPLTDGPDR